MVPKDNGIIIIVKCQTRSILVFNHWFNLYYDI